MAQELIKVEPILPKILLIDSPPERASMLVATVKAENLSLALTDHENFPTVSTIARTAGAGTVKMFLTILIEETVKQLSITNEPSKEQVLEMATELIKDHPTLKLEDFKKFFLNYRKGRYGRDFSRFDMTTIYRALEGDENCYPVIKGYLQERSELFEAELGKKRLSNVDKGERIEPKLDSADYNIDELIGKYLKPKPSMFSASMLRDKHRRAASEQYARQYNAWLTDNHLEHTEYTIIQYAETVAVFNSDYIDAYISEHAQKQHNG
jgi:nucleoid DNA-binding protein